MPEITVTPTSPIQVSVVGGASQGVTVSPGIGASVIVNGTATSIVGTAGINPFIAGANITITTTGGGITIFGRDPPVLSVQGKTGVVSLQAQDITHAVQSKAEGTQYAVAKIVRLSESAYASLATKDTSAVYFVASTSTNSPQAKVYLGWTVPGTPVMNDACSTHSDGPGSEFTNITFFPPESDGGSPILGYDLWIDNTPYENWAQGFTPGFFPNTPAAATGGGQWQLYIPEDVTGLDVSIRAYNAIGFGPLSNDVVGQFC